MSDMQILEPLRTIDGINRDNRGLRKAWLAKDKAHSDLVSECVLKVDYSVQDFNKTIENGFSVLPKDVV